jgi:uncharacterized membrane protein YphA (DoxX/SURF4 family)
MKWFDRSWIDGLLNTAANSSYIPGYSQLLQYSADYSGSIAIAVTMIEAVIGTFIILGILTRIAGALGALLDLNLLLTFAFCRCPWAQSDFPLVFWFYSFPIVLNVDLVFDNSSSAFGLRRILQKLRHSRTSNKE